MLKLICRSVVTPGQIVYFNESIRRPKQIQPVHGIILNMRYFCKLECVFAIYVEFFTDSKKKTKKTISMAGAHFQAVLLTSLFHSQLKSLSVLAFGMFPPLFLAELI